MFVDVKAVAKTFRPPKRPAVQALERTEFGIGAGEFVSVVGPSGCGKSTLLAMLAGLETTSEGHIEIDGRAIDGPFDGLGVAFQQDLLLEWRTVFDNVMLPVEVRGGSRSSYAERARELLEQVGLTSFAGHYPGELSGGMRQRVALCRALLLRPRLLLMDEPFGALDALTRDQMALDLQDVVADGSRAAVLVTHSIPEAVFMGDRVLVFSPRPGRIVESIDIDIPRPRRLADRDQPKFTAYVARILDTFVRQGTLRER